MEEFFEMKSFDDFLYWERISRDTIDFKKVYVDMTGDLIAGLMLSQLVYWYLPDKDGKSKLRARMHGKLCIAKSRYDWWDEIRITPRQADRALKILREIGLIETEYHRFNALRTTHICMKEDNFLKSLQDTANRDIKNPHKSANNEPVLHKSKPRSYTKGKAGLTQSVTPQTETTTQITTENQNISSPKELSDHLFLSAEPFNFSEKTILNLLKKEEDCNHTLYEYATWWKEKYYDKGKDGKPFPIIYTAMCDNWEPDDYYQWGFNKEYQ